jgi:uncharacterized alkaline shock family protein YloU
MRFFTHLAIYFYVLMISLVSGVVIFFVSRLVTLEDVYYYLDLAYNNTEIRMIVGIVAGALVVLSLIFERIIIAGRQRERTIAFDNPSGRVSVSLSAVEDLVRRLVYKMPDIKEVRPNIIATKKGIEIECRLILKADVNIPDLTLKLQELIKNRIQEILGLEEIIIVRIHVVKIISEESKGKRTKEEGEEKSEPIIPFQGYRS